MLWNSANNDPPEDPFDDGYEAYWTELFRLYAYVFAGIGLAGVALAIAMVW